MQNRRQFVATGLAAGWACAVGLPAFAGDSLRFDPEDFVLRETSIETAAGTVKVAYRFYGPRVYVARPVDPVYQSLILSVPVKIDGRAIDAARAPIVLANSIGGYMPSSFHEAKGVGESSGMPPPPPAADGTSATPTFSAAQMQRGKLISNAELALAAGFVVAEPGARGRTLTDARGDHYGVAPAAIVDLKAAVRYLRHNAGRIPGDTDHIISTGTSAGGALSALLGASGDSADYLPELRALGAAEASDAIFAAGAWCPIADLEHADMAYEWNWAALPLADGDGADAAISAELAAAFPAYQAGLGLGTAAGPLTAETYPDHLLNTFLRDEASAFLAALPEDKRRAYVADHPGLAVTGARAGFDWAGFIAHVGTRKKTAPAFDALDLSSGENNLFGLGQTAARHFTAFALRRATGDATAEPAPDLDRTLPMMNPMTYLRAANPGRARHWWLRTGAKDTDTALTVVGNLDAQARQLGDSVSTRFYWDAGHGANEDPEAFHDWIRDVTGYRG